MLSGSSATKRDVSLGRDNRERDQSYLEKIQTPHVSLIRECCRAHHGQEVKTMGDAFFLAFDDPVEVSSCAAPRISKSAWRPTPSRLRWDRCACASASHSTATPKFTRGVARHGRGYGSAGRSEWPLRAPDIALSAHLRTRVRHMTDVKGTSRGEFALKGVDRTALWEADSRTAKVRDLLHQCTSACFGGKQRRRCGADGP